MSGAAVSLGGAQQRLLPEVIPSCFFATAVIAHGLAWAGIAVAADQLIHYAGGPGPAAAVVHVLTLGVLLSTAMGASVQMLPVALGTPAPAARACAAAYGLLIAGASLLIAGFAHGHILLPAAGAAALAGAMIIYAAALSLVLRRASGNRLLNGHVAAALFALMLAVALAVLLAADYHAAWLPDHQGTAVAHMVLAVFGFMGLLAFGFSQILVPMFLVAEPVEGRLPALAFGFALSGLAVTVTGLIIGQRLVVATGIIAGLAAAGCHLWQMRQTLVKRIRKRLGGEFILIRFAWAMLPLALLLGLLLALDGLPSSGAALFGFIALFGWLLSLLLGVLQRILPFLASMHVLRAGPRPIPPGRLVHERGLRIHRWCHMAAVTIIAAGLLFGQVMAIRIGAAIGFAGAAGFAVFAASVFMRTRQHLKTAPAAAIRGMR
jgi:hypothetical protein